MAADHIEQALTYVRRNGASAAIRIARQRWVQQLTRVSVQTPEPALNLLLNRLLPCQCLRADAAEAAPALIWLNPAAAREAVLRANDPLQTAWYLARTDDASLLEETTDNTTHYDHLLQQLTSVMLGGNGLLLRREKEDLAFTLRYMLTLRLLLPFAKAEHAKDMQDMLFQLQTAVERQGWTGDCYALPQDQDAGPHSLVQALASFAGQEEARTRQALRSAWQRLYDPATGLLHDCNVEGAGQTMSTAICFLAALAKNGFTEEAWTLARAMNPIHRTLSPETLERYAAPPWLLPESISADGRAGDHAHSPSAAWFYVVMIEELLGFRLHGNRLRFTPRIPANWESYSLTLQYGASTWRFDLSRTGETSCDGEPFSGASVTLTDDGRIHQVRLRLRT